MENKISSSDPESPIVTFSCSPWMKSIPCSTGCDGFLSVFYRGEQTKSEPVYAPIVEPPSCTPETENGKTICRFVITMPIPTASRTLPCVTYCGIDELELSSQFEEKAAFISIGYPPDTGSKPTTDSLYNEFLFFAELTIDPVSVNFPFDVIYIQYDDTIPVPKESPVEIPKTKRGTIVVVVSPKDT